MKVAASIAPAIDQSLLAALLKTMPSRHRPAIRPSLVAGLLGAASWLKSPVKAWRVEKEQWTLYQSYRHLSKFGLTKVFKERPPYAIPPKFNDLYGLYLIAMQRTPEVMLELGGGCSTFVLAQAAHDLTQKGHPSTVHSVDQSEHWQTFVKDAMPDRLKPFVQYHISDVTPAKAEGVKVWRYESLPVEAANFVYVDGGTADDAEAIWADAYYLERNAPPDYAIQIDGRRSTCVFLNQHLQRDYTIGPGLRYEHTLFRPKS